MTKDRIRHSQPDLSRGSKDPRTELEAPALSGEQGKGHTRPLSQATD